MIIHEQGKGSEAITWKANTVLPEGVLWLDLINPTDDERECARKATGLRIPCREDIDSLALSSRIRTDDDAMYLSIPNFADCKGDQPPSPVGLVITSRILLTLRFGQSEAFDLAARNSDKHRWRSSADVLATLLESIVNLAAERMEQVGVNLRALSERVFTPQRMGTPALRNCMLEVGKLEGQQTRNRSSLLGIQRIVSFVRSKAPEWMADDVEVRLRVVDHDLRALDEFDDQLTNKLQFLLDASLGFINTDQNHVMKVLTVVSVATVPPVILAGIWGMNFKDMPELALPYAYPIALGTILLSMLIPVLFFKWRGWLSGD
nr:CorA family divalent cation transporter [Luteibacter sp. Sphag1AF]